MGPTVLLYLPHKLTDAQIAQINADVVAVSTGEIENEIWDWDFQVIDTRPIGGNYVNENDWLTMPFGIAREAGDGGVVEPAEIQAHFGFLPQQVLQLDAMTRGKPSELVLAEFALYYATAFEGVIDFLGSLLPLSLPYEVYNEAKQWLDVEMHFNNMVAGMPGKIVGIEYEVDENRRWITHVGDAVFLKAWLQHPDFHMVN